MRDEATYSDVVYDVLGRTLLGGILEIGNGLITYCMLRAWDGRGICLDPKIRRTCVKLNIVV